MLLIANKKMITHKILGYNPFKVEYINNSTGTTAIVEYAICLTKKEIESEYDYIRFPSKNKYIDENSEEDEYIWENDESNFMPNLGSK